MNKEELLTIIMISKDDLVLYDVCNDYSLDPCTTEFNASDYRTAKRNGGTVYTHKRYDEIHYYLGEAGLTGRNLFSL